MASKRTESMRQASFWTVDAIGPRGKPASAAHGFPGISQNASIRNVPRVHMGNVGLTDIA